MLTAELLKKRGYTLAEGDAGYWVEGACGYAVAAYFNSPKAAWGHAAKVVASADRTDMHPAWYLEP